MHQDDARWIAHIADGGTVGAVDEPSPGYRTELLRLLVTFVDCELSGAAGLADFINQAPGLPERISLARIVAEKFGHAEAVLALLERFGLHPALYVQSYAWEARLSRGLDLGIRRVGNDRRLNVFHYPLQSWEDVVTQTMLMGAASLQQLGDLRGSSYAPFAALVDGIVEREAAHAAEGERGLALAIERCDGNTGAAQAAVDYWYPRVAATFGRLDPEGLERYRRFGLRKTSNAALLRRWQDDAAARLLGLSLAVPRPPS